MNKASMNSSIDVMFGSHYLRKDTLDKFLRVNDSVTFSNYSQIVGISFSKTFKTDRFKEQDGYINVQYQLPNTAKGADSTDYTFSGYQIGFCFGGKDLFYTNEQFDLVYSLGVQFGAYYLKRQHRTRAELRQRSRNGLIAPQLVMEARYFIGKLKIGFKMRGQYDISKTSWKHLDHTTFDFGAFSATGFAFQGMLGYKLD